MTERVRYQFFRVRDLVKAETIYEGTLEDCATFWRVNYKAGLHEWGVQYLSNDPRIGWQYMSAYEIRTWLLREPQRTIEERFET